MIPLNDPILSPTTLRTYYLKALQHTTFIDELTTYQVSELLKYAKDIYEEACELALDLLVSNTNYPYPKEYKGGKEFNYWLERQSTVAESQKMQALCARRLDEIPLAPAPAKGTPAADVRRYFPNVATIHGTTASDNNAPHQLAVWLLHWADGLNGKRHLLPGKLREQMAAHPHAGKFLKACRRLHEALTPLAANEQTIKALLGKKYTVDSRKHLQNVLKRWADWIREQTGLYTDPAGAYLAALRSVPIVEEWEKGSPRYTIPNHLIGYDDFEAEIAPLRQAFEATLPNLAKGKKRALRHALNEVLTIDREGVQRHREQFERGEYSLDFLPADYPALRFDVAGQPGRFKWQWVGPMFWGGLKTLLQYKQMEARTAYEKLRAALGETRPISEPVATTQPLDTPAPPNTEPGAYPWAVIDALAERIELRIRGQFIPAPKWRATAVAGMIDALREAGILSEAETLPIQYAKFSTYYNCKVGAGRNGTTRIEWQKKARKDLGLI